MLTVLFLTQVPPYPLDSGSKIRNYHLLRSLARRHRVTLISFVRSAGEAKSARHLEHLGISVVTVPLKRSRLRDLMYFCDAFRIGVPFLVRRDRSPAMSNALRNALAHERFDVMHIDQLTMAQYAGLAREAGARVAIDVHDVVSNVFARMIDASTGNLLQRIALKAELPRLERYERKVCGAADVVLTLTDRDRQLLSRSLQSGSRIITVPPMIDCGAIQPVERQSRSHTLMTVGTLFYPPNADGVEWFIRKVFPLVVRSIPEVRFVAAGARPPRRLVSLAATDPRIELPGYVDDIADLAASAAAMVVPILVGGGARIKILQAFAMGIPVVSTRVGCEGIAATPGRHLLIADTAEDFARHVITLIEEPALGKRIATSARLFVEDTHGSPQLELPLNAAYELLDEKQTA